MKRVLLSLALIVAFSPVAARADQTAATLNKLALEQTIDCITTMAVLHSGGSERDPLALPFTHSLLTEVAAAAVLNIAARRIPVRFLRTIVDVYPVILIGNVRALGAPGGSAGFIQVPGGIAVRPRPHR